MTFAREARLLVTYRPLASSELSTLSGDRWPLRPLRPLVGRIDIKDKAS